MHWVWLTLAFAPLFAGAVVLPDEIGGDNFDGFDLTPCDASLASDSSAAADYAAAIDLCATTTEGSHAPGLISASLSLLDGSGTPGAASRRIRGAYGAISPRRGSAIALFSTGKAAGSGDQDYSAPQPGYDAAKASSPPADWLAAHGGAVPNPPVCQPISVTAKDPVMLELRIRVPNNAHSFSVDANYVTADFPEYACSSFTDLFVALLDASYGTALNPADKNIAAFPNGLPVSVNLATPNDGSFTQCVNGTIGCASGANPTTIATCSGTSQLVGTGMEVADPVNACSMGQQVGGGTGWFAIHGNVVPGDIIALRLAIWDTGDGTWDSNVAIDNFRWSYQTVQAGATLIAP